MIGIRAVSFGIIVGFLAGPMAALLLPAQGADFGMGMSIVEAQASFWGTGASDCSGSSVAGAGDVNGDGYDDLLIGAPYADYVDPNDGEVYLILGKAVGWRNDTSLYSAAASFYGENEDDEAGYSVAGAGDVNGDGYDDLLVGARLDDDGGSSAGQTYLILGKAAGWAMNTNVSASSASFWGEDAGDYCGCSVAGAGDVNGDGYDDILIGAMFDEDGGSSAGQTYLIFGKASGWAMDTDLSASSASFWGEDSVDWSGVSVAGAGDVNGDGYDDILIGAYGDDDGGGSAGQTYLILGKASGWAMDTDLSAASASFWGEDSSDYSGISVAGAGDVNGDGYDDMIIGAYADEDGGNGAGQTYLILGKASGWAMDTDLSASSASFWGEDASYYSGYSVAGAGDVNGDGYDDMLIGGYNSMGGRGKTHLVLGKQSGWAMDTDLSKAGASFLGEVAGDNAGFSVAGAGDVDGDGYRDILIGARYNDEEDSAAGQTYLIMPFHEPPPPENLAAHAFRDGDSITLTWTGPTRGSPTIYNIFRSTDGNNYDRIALVSHSSAPMSYIDADVIEGQIYFYEVVAVHSSGDASRMTAPIRVECVRPVRGSIPGFGMDADLVDSHASFLGEILTDESGRAVAGAGDVNGDGYEDILVGAYYSDAGGSNAGQTYLIMGKASGWAMDTGLSTASASFWGEDPMDYSGRAVAGAGDVNGDGYDDILIGAYGDDDGGADAGQAYLIFGKASGWAMDTDLSAASASYWGEDLGDNAGYCVAGAGDVNGDGYDDILIGAYGDDDGGAIAGQAYLILGKVSGWAMDTDLSAASASFWGEDADDRAGFSLDGAGDVNADGCDDIIIGAYGNDGGGSVSGQTYLVLGKAAGWAMDVDLENASASFLGEDGADFCGYSVAGAGDVNGDGYDDVIFGSYGDDDGGSGAGQVYMVFGMASGWEMDTDSSAVSASFWGEESGDFAGYYVAGAGDVNGDGYDDILIGAYGDDDLGSSSGQTYLILGRTSGWSMDIDLSLAAASFRGEAASDNSGVCLAGAGDVNGDGYDDILVGAPYNDNSGSNAGQTYIIMPYSRPPPPTNIQASLSPVTKQIVLSWDAAGFWSEPLTGYLVYRSTDEEEYGEVAFRALTDRTYTDTNVTYGRTYYYKVLTVDGNGAMSPATAMVSLVCDRDTDSDGTGDMADWDDDGDGYADGQDAFPLNPSEWLDTDCDGTGNNADTDDDNDGIPDASDAEPLNPQNELRYHLNFLNATLQTVQGQLTSAQALLALMNGNLTTLTTNVDSMNTGLTNLGNTIRADIINLGAGVAVNMSGMNATLRADIVALQGWLSGMNGTLRADIVAVQAGLSGMNATLRGDISTVVSGMAGMNATLRNDITAVMGNMAGLNATLRNDIVTVIGNMAGMNATLRNDMISVVGVIGGLNSTLQNDVSSILNNISKINTSLNVSQLTDGLSGINRTLQNNITTVLGNMAGMNVSLKNDVGSVIVTMAGMNASLKGDITGVLASITGMNSSLKGDMTSVLTSITGMNSTFRAQLLGMNASLSADISAVRTVITDVSADLSSMQAYIVGMNVSMAAGLSGLEKDLGDDITALEARLGADIAALGIALEAVNASIQLELHGLADDIATFREEVATGIAAIMAKLDQNNQTQNDNYGKLQALVNAINSTSLVEIRNQLAALRTDDDQMEAGLIARLDDFRNRTMTRLDNITEQMEILDDIKSLTTEVESLKTKVDDVKDQQAGTKKSVEALAPTSYGSMVLVVIVLVVAIVLLLMSRGKRNELSRPELTAETKIPPKKQKQAPEEDSMKP